MKGEQNHVSTIGNGEISVGGLRGFGIPDTCISIKLGEGAARQCGVGCSHRQELPRPPPVPSFHTSNRTAQVGRPRHIAMRYHGYVLPFVDNKKTYALRSHIFGDLLSSPRG